MPDPCPLISDLRLDAPRPRAARADKPCAECGCAFQPKSPSHRFCGGPCRKAFNNRCAARGAILLAAMMAFRYARPGAGAAGIDRTYLNRICEMFHREDLAAGRAGHPPVHQMTAAHSARINAHVGRI